MVCGVCDCSPCRCCETCLAYEARIVELEADVERLRGLLTDGTCKDCGGTCSDNASRCRPCANKKMTGRKLTAEHRANLSKGQQARRDREYEKMLDGI